VSAAYPDLHPQSEPNSEIVEMFTCPSPERVSGRPVLNEFGAGFALKLDPSMDGSVEPKIAAER
jgi:hypothetical protein